MNQSKNPAGLHLTAKQAADALGITRATLYAYTSRGQLRSTPAPGRPRERQYFRMDIDRLIERKEARRNPAQAAARGLHWGSPVLDSGITLIHDGQLYFRGRNALELAASASVEEIAALLWTGDEREASRLFDQDCPLSDGQLSRLRRLTRDPLIQMQLALPAAAAADPAGYDLRPPAVQATGARLLRLLTAVVSGRRARVPVHRALQAAWTPRRAGAADVIRCALILCADHELNVSAFTARCAASAGSCPYDVVSAGLAALKGYKHGGSAERVMALAPLAETAKGARSAVAGRLRLGEAVPGFGHRLYPDGDPRAVRLLELAQAAGNPAAWRPFRHLWRAGVDLVRDAPNLDFGLAAAARTYGLPDHAPAVLFALGRTVGWIAHAIEEYASGELIRPRARYTGVLPV